ncbi:hypothetical protein Glove_367g4 [Diversispora epigaea]|uniref:Treble clef zinc finger domain-containing protein n=1 Tax=Diversispora epigaea TaxID=1348612 RepID=A0A397HBW3_9GLOM|nr:hypothetical protein Glove_367g4 [Diversispora epigaea]
MLKKLSLDDAIKIAKEHSGEYLFTQYINISTPMFWKCKEGHTWVVCLKGIRNSRSWCRICSEGRYTLKDVKEFASNKGGECISTLFINSYSHLMWRCSKGHKWNASFHNVKTNGTWCPRCANVARCTLKDAIEFSRKKDGLCLSTVFINNHSPLSWRCSKGHEIKNQGGWCPYCAKSPKLTIEDAKQFAIMKNGQCISIEYKNIHTSLIWNCQYGHQWQACFEQVKLRKTWCPFCANCRNLEDAKKLALSRNGDNVKHQGTWCPLCKNKREKLCRNIVSKYLGPPSTIRRPIFTKTSEHPYGLELDIYYPQYGLAIEYDDKDPEKTIRDELFALGLLN